jgi:predicted nucleotidyltransferase
MIAQKDRETIAEIVREYRVAKVVLFGSSIAENRESQDIDVGVKGIEPRLFFELKKGVIWLDECAGTAVLQ